MKAQDLAARLRLPVIGSPMFIASGVELVVAQCRAGIVGAFPALNARPAEALERWIEHIETALAAHDAAQPRAPAAPYAVNLILHPSNDRLATDLATCVRRRVPIVITSVGDPAAVVEAVHGYGGLVLHDVIHTRHARKAALAGVDGLVLVCAGAGGHGGRLSPFAFVGEVKRWFDGLVVLGGAIGTGEQLLAARALGADLAYLGTRFLVAEEANVAPAYRQAVLDAGSADIVYTDLFSGVHANFLRASVAAAGFDPERLPPHGAHGGRGEDFSAEGMAVSKVWRDIWTAGQGVGCIDAVAPVARIVQGLHAQYASALARLAGPSETTGAP